MPPKKKGGKKSPEKSAPSVEVGTEETSKEQLEAQILRLREELDLERKERNYFQLERDKIHAFWEITKRQLGEQKAELSNKEREMEKLEMRHQEEIKEYKKKMKHSYYENQNNLTDQKMEAVVATKTMQTEHAEEENNLRQRMRTLKLDLKEQERSHEKLLQSQRQKQDEEMTKLRQDCETQVRDVEKKYEKQMKALREEVDLRRKMEIHEIEERKNSQINTLIKNHDKALSDMNTYFSQTIANNLALNNSLEQQLKAKMKELHDLGKDMAGVMLQNTSLTQTAEEVEELKSQMAKYNKDKASLAAARTRLKVAHKNIDDLKWEHEALQQLFRKVEQERDELYQKFTEATLEVQQKSSFNNLLVEEQLRALRETLERKDAQPKEVPSASANTVTNKMEDMRKS